MKNVYLKISHLLLVGSLIAFATSPSAQAQNQSIPIHETVKIGTTPPIPVALEGFTGEAAEVLNFDLYVQGCKVVSPDAAQYLIKGTSDGNVSGSLSDVSGRKVFFSKTYNGASTRRQAHAFADDIIGAIQSTKPIGVTKIAFKSQPSGYGAGEIYI